MIKNINKLKSKPVSFIKQFINNCTVEEKIDAHNVTVEITSKFNITVKKSSGKVIDRVDMILNSMWGQLVTDWNYIHLANQDLFEKHIGYNISMFYFPNDKPLSTAYKGNVKYLIDRITFNDEEQNISQFVDSIKMKDNFNIAIKRKLHKNIANIDLNTITGDSKETINYEEMFLNMIDKDGLLAKEQPEGYIFKHNKILYQILFNKPYIVSPGKSQYEYVLCDFINYCRNTNYQEKITSNYVKTVCALFNDYIINWEQKKHNIENNIDIDSIQPPTLGTVFDMGYEYIPDIITIKLCSNDLYKSIFKILLANLKKGKDNTRCIYMNKKQVDTWNNIMKNIKIRTFK